MPMSSNWTDDEPTTTLKYVRFATADIKLRLRLRRVYDDPDFDFGRYRSPQPCRSMAANGPMASHFDEITDRQWSMIEMLVGDHDEPVAATGKGRTA